jgi:succinate dehydrogenase / fumarate reductase, flavoprotein subunit
VTLARQPLPAIRQDLMALFDRGELAKYMTEEELTGLDVRAAAGKEGI